MSKPPLLKRHPNLFKTIMAIGVSNLVIAIFTMVDSDRASISFKRITSIELIHQPWFWIAAFVLAAGFCIYGALSTKYQMAKIGLVLSAAMGAFLALGFWVSYFTTGTIGISAPVVWTFYALICIINSSEPNVNPLSVALQQDIHKTIATENHIEGLKTNGKL
jgi:hypothetical protein